MPIADFENLEHLRQLEEWMRSYRLEELFDDNGKFREEYASLAPTGRRRMGFNPNANGGGLLTPLMLPDSQNFVRMVTEHGQTKAAATAVLGGYLRDVMKLNAAAQNFRLFDPHETASNRLHAPFEVTGKAWMEKVEPVDVTLSQDGRVMEVLSEHLCQGQLEGYLLTGRHGLFQCYEAFVHIVDSMVNQHAKWLKVSKTPPWCKPIASLNYLLTSRVWRQDRNGSPHRDPGFIGHIANKTANVARIYLPPDANCLSSVTDHANKSRGYVSLIVAGKQPEWQWFGIDAAVCHCTAGAESRDLASDERDPDVVMACAGDVPTLEALAAVTTKWSGPRYAESCPGLA